MCVFGCKPEQLGRNGRNGMVCGPSVLRIKCPWGGKRYDSGNRKGIPLF